MYFVINAQLFETDFDVKIWSSNQLRVLTAMIPWFGYKQNFSQMSVRFEAYDKNVWNLIPYLAIFKE